MHLKHPKGLLQHAAGFIFLRPAERVSDMNLIQHPAKLLFLTTAGFVTFAGPYSNDPAASVCDPFCGPLT